jgi:hypothetical protein
LPGTAHYDVAGKAFRRRVQITVQVSKDVALALQGRAPHTAAADDVLQRVRAHGLPLVPMHPGVEDPRLGTYFVVEVTDREIADQVLDELLQSPAVEAAYIKPPDALP